MREIYKDLLSGMKDGGPAHDLAAEMVAVINQMLETKTKTLVGRTDRKIFFSRSVSNLTGLHYLANSFKYAHA